MRAWMLGVCLIVLTAAISVRADEPKPESITEKIKLAHVKPQGLMQILSRESPSAPRSGARLNAAESLMPLGVQGLIAYPLDDALIVRGTPQAVQLLLRGIRVADVKPEPRGGDRVQVTLEPKHATVLDLAAAVRKLANPGSVDVYAGKLVLEGKSEWIYQCLRTAIRLEMAVTPQPAPAP